MVRGIANSKIGFGDLILLLRYFFKLKVSTHPNELKKIFAHQASIDPSITASFNVFFQSCTTGESIALYINDPLLEGSVTQDLNYWNRF